MIVSKFFEVVSVTLKMKEKTVINSIILCPYCGKRHYDIGKWARNPHHTHLCLHCNKLFRLVNPDDHFIYFKGS